jgi:tripartite-type tricarboxylate transporter receptor subunit TctC
MKHFCSRVARGLLAAAMLTVATAAWPQTYPSRDITFVVPFNPGGGTDPIARQFAAGLEKVLHQSVNVENKPGGSATIGIGSVVRAKPDGYTIGLGTNAALVHQPLINSGLAYKTPDDYQSIIKLVELPSILVVRADAPWKTFQEFIADAKKNPGKIRVSVSGLGTIVEMVVQQVNKNAGVKITPVPFTGGGGEGLVALLGGRVQGNVTSGAAGIAGHVQAGTVKVLAVVGKDRYEPFPDATPMVEAGYDVTLPYACYVLAPKGLPKDVLDKLVAASLQVARSPEFLAFAKTSGMVVDAKGPEAMKAELVSYTKVFSDLIKFIDQK